MNQTGTIKSISAILCLLLAGSGCQKTEAPNATTKVEPVDGQEQIEQRETAKLRPDSISATQWTLNGEDQIIVVDNIGWQECDETLFCTYHDYSTMTSNTATETVYRTVRQKESSAEAPYIFEARFDDDIPKAVTDRIPGLMEIAEEAGAVRKWQNTTWFTWLDQQYEKVRTETLQRCLTAPGWETLKHASFKSYGNTLVGSEWVFWLDRNIENLLTSIEISPVDHKVLGIATMQIGSFREMGTTLIPPSPERVFHVFASTGHKFLTGKKPMQLRDFDEFMEACDEAYFAIDRRYDSDYSHAIDPKASKILHRHLQDIRSGIKERIFHWPVSIPILANEPNS